MVQIVMALEARVDWTIKTNPFGSAEPQQRKKADIAAAMDDVKRKRAGSGQR